MHTTQAILREEGYCEKTVVHGVGAEPQDVAGCFSGGGRERQVSMEARNLVRLGEEIGKAKAKFGLPEGEQVRSCYEPGRDGFWLHRYLVGRGIENVVLESASIEVDRRARRAKTDRLDGGKLLKQLVRRFLNSTGDRRTFDGGRSSPLFAHRPAINEGCWPVDKTWRTPAGQI